MMRNLKIDAPSGTLVAGLSDTERYIYDQIEAENWSSIKPYSVPQKARWREQHPEEADTEALRFGRMAHELVLTPKIFSGKYIGIPQWSHGGGNLLKTARTTKDEGRLNKIEKIAWEAEFKDYERVEADVWKQLHDMRDALMEDKITSSILNYPNSMREVTCLSQLSDGTWTKSVFDIRLELDSIEANAMFRRDDMMGGVYLGDYKTARSAEPKRFQYAIRDYGYRGQGAFYADNHWRATGHMPTFFFFAQDKYDGYTPCVFIMSYGDIKQGIRDYEYLLKRKRECKASNYYPGYAESAIYLGGF